MTIAQPTPEQRAELIAAAAAFMGFMLGAARASYGPEFDAWPPEDQHAATLGACVETLLFPESFGSETIDLEKASFAVGVALGNATAHFPHINAEQLVRVLLNGFNTGRAQTIAARTAFPTIGNA